LIEIGFQDMFIESKETFENLKRLKLMWEEKRKFRFEGKNKKKIKKEKIP